MRRIGVGSLRFPIYWSQSEPAPGVFDWTATDVFLTSISRYGFERLPFVWGSPSWLTRKPRAGGCRLSTQRCLALRLPVHSPYQRRAWSSFLRALVGRYGPSGTFWGLHPELREDPIRIWQIWNEENDHRFAEASVRGYAALLRASAPAIRSVDPDAQIVLGGLYASPRVKPSLDATVFLSRLSRRRGIRGLFDAVGLHPYAVDPSSMAARIKALRAVMRSHREGSKGLYVTEFGWGSQTRAAGGDKFERGPAAQATDAKSAWKILLANRRRWNLRAAYWFTWQDIPAAGTSCDFCDSAGLLDLAGDPKPSLHSFARAVRRTR
jgi:polysaccharide biosynthesis protein PslG